MYKSLSAKQLRFYLTTTHDHTHIIKPDPQDVTTEQKPYA